MNRNVKNAKAKNFRRLRFGTASTVLTIAVIVVVLLLNILVSGLADRYPLTWDLSTDKVFTLSEKASASPKALRTMWKSSSSPTKKSSPTPPSAPVSACRKLIPPCVSSTRCYNNIAIAPTTRSLLNLSTPTKILLPIPSTKSTM